MKQEEAVRLAQAEVTGRSWGVSQVVLAVNEVDVGIDGMPVVARVDEESEPGAYFVYFPIRKERYYFVVVIRADEAEQLHVSAVYVEAGVRVYLIITSVELSCAEITSRAGLTPTKTHAIGDPITPMRKYQEHSWLIEPRSDQPGSVEEKVAVLMDIVEPAAARIASLKPACSVHVGVVFKGWGGDPQFGGFNFDARTVERLASLGAELGFDLHAFGPAMRDEEAT